MATTGRFMLKGSKYPAPKLTNRDDLIWVAGYLEGEGSFYQRGSNMLVTVSTVDEDVARRAHAILGGRVKQVKLTVTGKPVWRVDVTVRRYAYGVMAALYDLMGERRQAQIEKCLLGYAGMAGTR